MCVCVCVCVCVWSIIFVHVGHLSFLKPSDISPALTSSKYAFCIRVFRVILTVNLDYFLKRH
jgi:hypothetical protein